MKSVRGTVACLAIMGVLVTGAAGAPLTNPKTQPERPSHQEAVDGAPATATPRVVRDVLATAVVDREPVQVPPPIPAEVGRLYYFTEVVEAGSPRTILHLWYWRNRSVSVVLLEVNGPRFRTWSYKTIPPAWTGEWRVEARTPDGTILSSRTFRVELAEGTDDKGTDQRR
ncbi:MAG: DUF2914 domain-containing protein [Candidatus Methylomirabilales bacterium]